MTARWPYVLALALTQVWAAWELRRQEIPAVYARGYTEGREDEGRAALRYQPHVDRRGDSVTVVYYGMCRETRAKGRRLP